MISIEMALIFTFSALIVGFLVGVLLSYTCIDDILRSRREKQLNNRKEEELYHTQDFWTAEEEFK